MPLTVEPQFTGGAPSVSVSGGGLSIVGAVKLHLSNIQTNSFVMNVSNFNIHGNNAVVRQGTNFSEIQANLSIQQTIQKDILNENDKQEVISIFEEIKTANKQAEFISNHF